MHLFTLEGNKEIRIKSRDLCFNSFICILERWQRWCYVWGCYYSCNSDEIIREFAMPPQQYKSWWGKRPSSFTFLRIFDHLLQIDEVDVGQAARYSELFQKATYHCEIRITFTRSFIFRRHCIRYVWQRFNARRQEHFFGSHVDGTHCSFMFLRAKND